MSKLPNEPETQTLPPFDASLIDSAPVEPDQLPAVVDDNRVNDYIALVGELSDMLAEAEAEIERLTGQQTVDQVRAALLAPYSKRVFWFVVGYCAVVGLILLIAGWGALTGFALSDAILGIIAGSTAVSVIGLIGMVITGLFGTSNAQEPPRVK